MRALRQLERNAGQGLTEVLVVVGLFGTLVAVGLPAYLGFQDRMASNTAQANLEAAVPAAQVFHTRHGTYAGVTSVDLLRIDPRISPTIAVAWAHRSRLCLTETVRGNTWSVTRSFRGQPSYQASTDCT